MSNKGFPSGPQHGSILSESRCFNAGYLKGFGRGFAAADTHNLFEKYVKNLKKAQPREFCVPFS